MRRYHRNPAPHRRLFTTARGNDVSRFQIALRKRLANSPGQGKVAPPPTGGLYAKSTDDAYDEVAWWLGLPQDHPPTTGAQKAIRWPWTRGVKARRRAKRRRHRSRPGQLTANFHVREFHCHDGTKVPANMHDDLRDLCRRVLEPLRDEFGACRVMSGYRHASYNASIGGASASFHIYDLRDSQPAADVIFERGNPAQWAARARELLGDTGGVGEYRASGFVHCDTRSYRADWSG